MKTRLIKIGTKMIENLVFLMASFFLKIVSSERIPIQVGCRSSEVSRKVVLGYILLELSFWPPKEKIYLLKAK
jgi:hypothetical protein